MGGTEINKNRKYWVNGGDIFDDKLYLYNYVDIALYINIMSMPAFEELIVQPADKGLIELMENKVSISCYNILNTIFELHKLTAAAFPVTLIGLKSTSIICVSVPPENILNPLFFKVSDNIFALASTDLIYSLNSGLSAS